MKVEYKRDLQNNYMILEAAQGAEEDGYHLRMAEQNTIPGLLSFHSGKRDGKLYLHYEITSKQSIENLYARNALGYQDILFLLNGISDTLEGLQKYLLNPAHLLFDPQFIFTYPDRSRIFLCYLPGENEYSITGLAEFILKRLNHEDTQAVALGYQFYQSTLEENFSLQKTLKEILLSGESFLYANQRGDDSDGSVPYSSQNGKTQKEKIRSEEFQNDVYSRNADDMSRCQGKSLQGEKSKEKNKSQVQRETSGEDESYNAVHSRWQEETNWDESAEYEITHKVRKKRSRYKAAADWVFERIHPWVILSALFLIVVVETAFFLGWLSLTEAGGIFFLIISVEILVNKFWKSRKEKKHQKWWEEDPEEEYLKLKQEVYREEYQEENRKWDQEQERTEYIEETRCLVPESGQEGLRLVCLNSQSGKSGECEKYQDIFIGAEMAYVGKLRGESDVLLDSPTVSRMHARLEKIDGKYYVKDLNSKNGTFINGKRLMPQEQCEISEGDRVAFAEVLYHVIER